MLSLLHRRVTESVTLALITALAVAGLTASASAAVVPTSTSTALPTSTAEVNPSLAARYGTGAARLTRSHRSWVNVYTRPQAEAAEGTKYRATGFVRAERRAATARVRVRQVVGTRTVVQVRTVELRATPRAWRKVTVTLRPEHRASRVQVYVSARVKGRRAAVRVSDVRIHKLTPPAGSEQTPTPARHRHRSRRPRPRRRPPRSRRPRPRRLPPRPRRRRRPPRRRRLPRRPPRR